MEQSGFLEAPVVHMLRMRSASLKNCIFFLHVSGQLLPCNGQPDLLSYLRDNFAIFAGFGDDFDTLGMSLELLYTALYDRKTSGN